METHELENAIFSVYTDLMVPKQRCATFESLIHESFYWHVLECVVAVTKVSECHFYMSQHDAILINSFK